MRNEFVYDKMLILFARVVGNYLNLIHKAIIIHLCDKIFVNN
jgi:hypothetical protein